MLPLGSRAALALLVASACAHPARAETHCRGIEWGTPALERMDAGKRLRFIRDALTRDAHRARIWQAAWLGIYGAVSVANTVGLVLSKNDADYIDWGLGLGSSMVGFITVAIPGKVFADSRWLSRRVGDAAPGENQCALLADAERVLLRDAHDEQFKTSALAHAGSFLFNLGIAGALIAIGHLDEALMHGLVGIAVGEIQIDTMPTGAVKALRYYRLGLLDGLPKPPPVTWALLPAAAHGRYTLSLALTF